MTKYLLHGGRPPIMTEEIDDGFFGEMVAGLPGPINILVNYFSREAYNDQVIFAEDKDRIRRFTKRGDLEFELADPVKFVEQLKRADVLYLVGGHTFRLLENLGRTPDARNYFDGKIVAGSSAGAYVLVKYFWSNDFSKIGEGLGVLNIKAFCHYTEAQKENLEKLIKHRENLPVITLPEFRWVTIFA